MELLPHNCRRSEIKVFPENWEEREADAKILWYIYYRFYDPNYSKEYPKGKLVAIRGMNKYTDLKNKRIVTAQLKNNEESVLKNGYNPHVKGYPYKEPESKDVGPKMPFASALQFADSKIKVSPGTRSQETGHLLKQILVEAKKQGLSNRPINEITRRHLKEIIEVCAITKNNKEYSRDKYNRCRKVLSYYYKELLDYEVVEANIPASLNKEKLPTKRVEASISPEMQKKVSEYLKANFRSYWLYLQVFYNSAPRSTEMMRLKVKDVDLRNQRIKFTILKGRQVTEKYRVIPDIAIEYWREIVGDAPEGWYVFGRGLLPSETPIKAYQVHKRWYRLITKNEDFKNIGITFYQLKHLRLTDVADNEGIDQAAMLAAENQKTVSKHYDLNTGRQDEKLRKSGKEF